LKAKKIFILLPDGIGLRNFAYTSFVDIGEKLGWEVVFWNSTPFDLTSLGFQEIKLTGKPRAWTDLLKRAKINTELNHFSKKFNDPVYNSYKFTPSTTNFKTSIKNKIVFGLTRYYKGESGLLKLRSHLQRSECNSDYFKECKLVLEREKPDFLFCCNQRAVTAISPVEAAKNLNIPTAAFIFSWDNLSKATMIIEPDYYFVWSDYMQQELIKYYPHIQESEIHSTGTPQFEPHFNNSLIESKDVFYNKHGLDEERIYICYSGDDVTTSPNDPKYLEDVVEAVSSLNKRGFKVGIIFRRCPVDFSDRYDVVLEKFKGLIIEIKPRWSDMGGQWNTIFPLKEDLSLQVNTIYHSIAIINLGSTMVFDAAAQNRPCFYINYNVKNKRIQDWSVKKIYKYVHFRSMPSSNAVIWINNPAEISGRIIEVIKNNNVVNVKEAQSWFKIINKFPAEKASERIWKGINEISEI
jgi:hypothetical protein